MIQDISEWIRSLAYLVLAASLLELVVPQNQMNRLVKVIVGFFITAAMVVPVVNWVRTSRGLTEIPFWADTAQTQTAAPVYSLQTIGTHQAESLYRSTIELELIRRLHQNGIPAQVRVDWTTGAGLTQVTARVAEEDSARVVELLAEMLAIGEEQVKIEN